MDPDLSPGSNTSSRLKDGPGITTGSNVSGIVFAIPGFPEDGRSVVFKTSPCFFDGLIAVGFTPDSEDKLDDILDLLVDSGKLKTNRTTEGVEGFKIFQQRPPTLINNNCNFVMLQY